MTWTKEEILRAWRGVPVHYIRHALRTFGSGVDWNGSSKSFIAEAWEEGRYPFAFGSATPASVAEAARGRREAVTRERARRAREARALEGARAHEKEREVKDFTGLLVRACAETADRAGLRRLLGELLTGVGTPSSPEARRLRAQAVERILGRLQGCGAGGARRGRRGP